MWCHRRLPSCSLQKSLQLQSGRTGTTNGAFCRTLSSAAPSHVSPLDLVDWVKMAGGSVKGVSVANLSGRDGGSGWGLLSTAAAAPGMKLLELPSSCHLTYSEASVDSRLLRLIEQIPPELWGAKLALQVGPSSAAPSAASAADDDWQVLSHRVRGSESPLHLYIANLPVGVAGIPIFFPREAIAAIDYPPVVEQVKKRCKWLYDFSQNSLAKLPGTPEDPFNGATIDINAVGWALACVTSRAFRTRGPKHPASCLPLIDMANHSFKPNVEVRPTDSGIGLFAKQQLSAGDALLLDYGSLSNDFLFMDYGFIVPDNPHDRVQAGAMLANVEVDRGEQLELRPAAWQHTLLTQLGLEGPGANTEVSFGGDQNVDPRLLAAARILVAQSKEEVQGRTLERLGQLSQPLNRQNERCALRALSGVAAYSLSRFTTTLEQDEEMLLRGVLLSEPAKADALTEAGEAPAPPPPLSDEMRLALRFRVEKKRILSAAIQRMGRQLQGLSKAAVSEHSLAARKGQAPPAATDKGFGKRGGK